MFCFHPYASPRPWMFRFHETKMVIFFKIFKFYVVDFISVLQKINNVISIELDVIKIVYKIEYNFIMIFRSISVLLTTYKEVRST